MFVQLHLGGKTEEANLVCRGQHKLFPVCL